MNLDKNIIDIGVSIGSLIGYATIAAGVIMTILLLQTVITGDYI
jgi:3-oxoacyl-(acyl-carrier-protein) synthase